MTLLVLFIITVIIYDINKHTLLHVHSPVMSPVPGLIWKGVLANGKSGLFDPTNAVPFIEPSGNPVTSKNVSIVRRGNVALAFGSIEV